MNSAQEIERLDAQINQLMTNYPGVWGILRISPSAFRACTRSVWEAGGWNVSTEETGKIMNGNESQRREALLSLLKAHYIHKVEFVPGVDIVEVVPDPAVQDEV